MVNVRPNARTGSGSNAIALSQDGPEHVSKNTSHAPDNEADLIQAAQGGDRAAFTTLIEHYWERLYRWLCRLARDGPLAEDLTQETFMKAFAALDRFRVGSNFRAWLFRIAHNNFINQRRTAKQNKQPLQPDIAETPLGPVAEVLSREAMKLIADGVAKLPSDFRAALLLRIEEDLSFREIADVLEITEETARWRVFKARQKLMSLLSPDLLPAQPEPKSP